MELEKIHEIKEKVEGMKTYEEIMKNLSDEEVVAYLLDEKFDYRLAIHDSCLIKDILKLIGSKKYSVRHAIEVLDVTKEILKMIARFNF